MKSSQTLFVVASILGVLLFTQTAFGQGTVRLGLLAGACFDTETTSESCGVVSVFEAHFFSRSVLKSGASRGSSSRYGSSFLNMSAPSAPSQGLGIGGGVAVFYAPRDMAPPPPEPGDLVASPNAVSKSHQTSAEQTSVDHGGVWAVLGDIVLPVSVRDRTMFEFFAGAGLAGFRGEDETPDRNTSNVVSKSFPALTFGLAGTLGVTDKLGIRIEYRGLVMYPGSLQYMNDREQTTELDVSNISASNLLFGLSYKI